MEIVVDVNVILSSLWKRGNSLKVFELNYIFNKLDFIAPEFLMTEFEKHKKNFFEKSKLSKEEFDEVLEFIFEQITFVSESEFSECLPQAKKILSEHLKDVQYLALALKVGCPIFSGDKRLKDLVFNSVGVFSPKEMLGKF